MQDGSWYRRACVEVVNMAMKNDPRWVSILTETLEKIKDGFFPRWYTDMIMQKIRRFDIYDAFSFYTMDRAIQRGDIYCTKLLMGFGPERDGSPTTTYLTKVTKYVTIDNSHRYGETQRDVAKSRLTT